jgi:hypothetical protein
MQLGKIILGMFKTQKDLACIACQCIKKAGRRKAMEVRDVMQCATFRKTGGQPRSWFLQGEKRMRVDLYRRAEIGGQFSYLAVPQGKPIPEEATNTDWEAAQRDIDLERNDERKTGLSSTDAFQQINDKGYAISSIKNLNGIGHPM